MSHLYLLTNIGELLVRKSIEIHILYCCVEVGGCIVAILGVAVRILGESLVEKGQELQEWSIEEMSLKVPLSKTPWNGTFPVAAIVIGPCTHSGSIEMVRPPASRRGSICGIS